MFSSTLATINRKNIMKTRQIIILSFLVTLTCSCGSNEKKVQNESDLKIVTKNQKSTTDSIQVIIPSKQNENEVDARKQGSELSNNTIHLNTSSIQLWDLNTIIGEAIIWRTEKTEGSNDWSDIVVANIFGFKNDVPVGELVQLFPLRKELPIIELGVIKTNKRDELDTDIWYEVELENIPEEYEEYWNIKSSSERRPEYPSDLLFVYPAINSCTLLQDIHFETKDLPINISNDVIKGALDFDGDELPDAIVCTFCCSTRQPVGDCEYTCGEIYIKVNNKWTMINSSQPM